ncbi:hypothetical protein N8862_02190, partial [Pseudomonadales bacterium]|nr:hypothetical protein [Pseudomonadales bacterium]
TRRLGIPRMDQKVQSRQPAVPVVVQFTVISYCQLPPATRLLGHERIWKGIGFCQRQLVIQPLGAIWLVGWR